MTKIKPWAVPQAPAPRKKHAGLKRPAISPEMKQYLRELEDVGEQLNAWASGESRFLYIASYATRIPGFSKPVASSKPSYTFLFTGFKKMFYDPVIKERIDEVFDWKAFIKTIPDLKGQIIGSQTIVWGHKITFKKWTNPILSKYGDTLSENAGMTTRCECGWVEKDILPKCTKQVPAPDLQGLMRFKKPVVDFAKLEEAIMAHIQGTFEEIEYIVLPLEFLEDVPGGFRKALLSLLKDNGAIMHFDFDTRNYLIIDDAMPDEAIAELTEMLAGYDVGTRKVRVLRP